MAETGVESCVEEETKFCKHLDLLDRSAANKKTVSKTRERDQRSFGETWKVEKRQNGNGMGKSTGKDI